MDEKPHNLVEEIFFPRLSFVVTEFVSVLEFLRFKADKERPNWFIGEVAFEYRFSPSKSHMRVSIELRKVSLWQALTRVCGQLDVTPEIRGDDRIVFADAKKRSLK
jgi:uncharacterized protein (DUF2126 family)